MNKTKSVGRISFGPGPTDHLPARRFSDSLSPLNEGIHDKARLVTQAIAMLDHLGIEIIEAKCGNDNVARNPSIRIMPCRACAQLGGAVTRREAGTEKWVASRFGCEITWYMDRRAA